MLNKIEKLESEYPHASPIVYQIISSFCFALIGLSTKLLKDIPPSQTLYIRSLFGFIALYTISQKFNINCYPSKHVAIKLLAMRSILGAIGTVCYFQSYQLLPLSEAIVLSKLQPLWTALASAYILKIEKMTCNLIITIILSLIGIIFIARPPQLLYFLGIQIEITEYEYHFLGVLLALIFSITSSWVQILISYYGKEVHQITLFLYFSFFTIFAPTLYQFYSPFKQIKIPNFQECQYLAINIVSGFFAQIFMNRSFIIGNLNQLSLVGQSQVIFSFLIDLFILKQTVDILTIFGTILIFSCLFKVIRRKKQILNE